MYTLAHIAAAMSLALSLSTTSFAQETTPSPQTSAQTSKTVTEQPPWQVCNETSFVLDMAIAGVPAGQAGQPISVWGWTSLRPGACQIVDVEKGTPRFVYARSATLHQGGMREWKGHYDYCVAKDDFTAKTDISCDLQNMTTAQFLQIIPTESRTAFVEPDGFGRFAETAGLQRLLMDNNYDIKRIDGRSGKRTTNTLRKFLKDHNLKTNISVDAKFTALLDNARAVRANVGVRLCNKSSAKLWAALAYENNGTMEAQGWWPIDKGSCVQPFAENLKDRNAHYYARQETVSGVDNILKTTGKNAKEFCIGSSKFSSLHHEFCQDQGYVPAQFLPVPTEKPGAQINLIDTDFSNATVSGLR